MDQKQRNILDEYLTKKKNQDSSVFFFLKNGHNLKQKG